MSIRRSLVYSFAQRYAGFLISFAATMALARLLTPAEIGVYSVGAAFVGLAQILRDFGVGRYLVQERELTEAHVQSVLGVGLILGVAVAGLLYLVAAPVAAFYRAAELADILHVLSLSFLLIPFTTPAMALLERALAFNLTFRIHVLNAIAHATTGVSLAFAGFGPISLAWASLAGVATSLLALLALHPRSVVRRPSLQHWRQIASFGGQSSVASIVGHLGTQAPDLIVGRLLGFQAVGFYSRAQGLIQVFQQQFVRAITDVVFPATARAHRQGQSVKPTYLSGLSYVTVVAWPFFGTMFLLAESVMVVLFGDQWRPSAPLAQALCTAGAVTAISSLALPLMISMGRIDCFLKVTVIGESCRITLIFLAAAIFASIQTVAWAQLPVSALTCTLIVTVLSKLAGMRMMEIAQAIAPSLGVAAPVMICATAAKLLLTGWSDSAILAIVTAAACVAWFAAVFAFKHPIYTEFTRLRHFALAHMSRS